MNWLEKLVLKVVVKKAVRRLDKMGKGWRSITIFALSGVAYMLAWPELTEVLDPKWIAIGTTVIGIVLRVITTTPLGQKE